MNKEYQRHKNNRRHESGREQRQGQEKRRKRDFDKSATITDQPKGHSKMPEAEKLKNEIDGIKNAADSITQLLCDLIDQDASNIGLFIADIFKTLNKAAAQLPAMELNTEMMYLCINDHEDFRRAG